MAGMFTWRGLAGIRLGKARPGEAARQWARANWRALAEATCLALILMGGLAAVQFSTPNLVGTDGYYHIKMAALMRQEGWRVAFPWLPLSILNPREFYDHHFLFHALLAPFTAGDLRVGAKAASVVFAGAAFLAVWRLLRGQGVPYAAIWTLGLLGISEAFLYRMSMPRAQSLSLAALVLGMDWMLRGKHGRLVGLGFFYVWLYDGFPLLALLAAAHTAAVLMVERRWELRPLLAVLVGIGLGSFINPYFPHNVIFTARHILPKLGDLGSVRVGNEWYPYDTGQLLENSPAALLAFASGALALGLSKERMATGTATAFLAAAAFGVMLFQARRFVEYFPAFALIFAALAWRSILQAAREAGSESEEIKSRMSGWLGKLGRLGRRWAPAAVLVVALSPALWVTLRGASESVQASKPYELYAEAAGWLLENTPAGARVFQTDWDDFPRLFYYNIHNTYLVGLDPTYLQEYDAELYALWVDISQGEVEEPAKVIAERFAAGYVFTDLKHTRFLRQAEKDPGLVEVYRDEEAAIFAVTGYSQEASRSSP